MVLRRQGHMNVWLWRPPMARVGCPCPVGSAVRVESRRAVARQLHVLAVLEVCKIVGLPIPCEDEAVVVREVRYAKVEDEMHRREGWWPEGGPRNGR